MSRPFGRQLPSSLSDVGFLVKYAVPVRRFYHEELRISASPDAVTTAIAVGTFDMLNNGGGVVETSKERGQLGFRRGSYKQECAEKLFHDEPPF